jgi:tetratricopeptide (TPR) repeat protein
MNIFGRVWDIVARWYSELGSLVTVAAALTTMIGAGTAAFGVYSTWHDHAVRSQTVAAAVRLADNHLKDHDYALSWGANAKALELAPTDAAALTQQSRIAMAWLEDVRLSSKSGATTFGEIADPLLDALVKYAALPAVHGVELADIKAHIGWARFLRSRDGVTGLRIADEFTDALKSDPDNMYGHVMRGFVILWDGGRPEAARADFDAALKSPVDPPYRDRMILAALFNSTSDDHQFAAVDYANKIRKSGRRIEADSQRRLLWIYEIGLHDTEHLARLSTIIPFDEHIATLDWVLTDQADGPRRQNDDVLKAYFLESAGKNQEALALYRQVLAAESPETPGRVVDLARSGIRRLSPRGSGGNNVGCPSDNTEPKHRGNVPGSNAGCQRN